MSGSVESESAFREEANGADKVWLCAMHAAGCDAVSISFDA